MDINSILLIALLAVLLLLAMFLVPQWRLRRAIRQVIRILREHHAIDSKNAKTVNELGLRPRSIIEGIFKGRDYRQYAITALMKAEIIKRTEDGRLYLLEDKLSASRLGKGASYS